MMANSNVANDNRLKDASARGRFANTEFDSLRGAADLRLNQELFGRYTPLAPGRHTKRGELKVDEQQIAYIDAKTDAVRAQNEASFARIEAQISKLPTADDVRGLDRDIKGIKTNIWGATATVIAIVLAVFALWAAGFDSGIQVTSTSVEEAIGGRQAADENAKQIGELNQKVDALLGLLRERVNQ